MYAKEDLPGYKLETKGSQNLTNAELLAILLNCGTNELSAIDIAKLLLRKTNNQFQQIGTMTVSDILNLKIKGIGKSKATLILAALEIGLRREQEYSQSIFISSSAKVAAYLRSKYQYYQREIMIALFISRNNRIIKEEIITEGGLSSTTFDLRVIFRMVFIYKATALLICHNHPSGDIENSKDDDDITKRIHEACKLLDIIFFDHIIVGTDGYFSYAQNGMLKK